VSARERQIVASVARHRMRAPHMRLSMIAARSENNVIGSGVEIPWKVKGEQLLFKAMTYNQWLIVGRTTFASIGLLPDRKYAVISSTLRPPADGSFLVFSSVDQAIAGLSGIVDHAFISGGGQIYDSFISLVDCIHLSTIHCSVDGNVVFPPIPEEFRLVFEQDFSSNIYYTYQIWSKLPQLCAPECHRDALGGRRPGPPFAGLPSTVG
jgi:dihydrofolate reductase (trimethoprim resistance protein)